ncbi:hypothetical protein [Pectobacterium aroidearum]|uniref:hypothetical protein n=1 Tax=Pectobacterium aroidearum TaxID=1201031 RepID=UPI003015E381
MSDKFDFSDYLRNTLGSYSPYSLRIILNKTYSEDNEDLPGIDSFNKRDYVTLFHEFTHQLQNISSIIGFKQFNSIISIWHNTRNIAYDPNDTISNFNRDRAMTILQSYHCVDNNRPQKFGLLNITHIDGLDGIKAQKFTENPIKINYLYNDTDFSLTFGIGEFYESCADTLECFFAKKIKLHNNGSESTSIPYKIAESMAKKICPECSEFRLIILMLTSLQHAAPHQMLVFLMYTYGKIQCDDQVIKNKCEEHVKNLLDLNTVWAIEIGNMIDNGFPYKDPYLGDVIKSFNISIKENINNRKNSPFIELDFLMEINEINYKEKIKSFIESFGGSIIYAKNQFNEMEKIVIGDCNSIYHNHKGWLTFNTSIAISSKKPLILNESNTINYEEYKCPVISYCDHENKINNYNFCEKSPFNHPQASEAENNCAHQLALYKTDLKNHYK